MTTLSVKRRRDIARQKWQYIAVLVTVILGVALFAGSFNAYLNLGTSLDSSYERLAMADITITGADHTFVETAQSIPGVSAAIERRQADAPIEIGEFGFLGRVIGMPPDEQPAVNRIDIDEGVYLSSDDESGVVIESHAAADFGVTVGDTIQIAGSDASVIGIATSPEYLWPAKDSQSMFTPPKSFGVVFVDERQLERIENRAIVDQAVVLYENGVDREAVDSAVSTAAVAANSEMIRTLAEQPSNFTIRTEIDGLQTIAIALPVLFLTAAGMAIYVVVTRLVFSQRAVIGTLRASGFSRRAMSRHYRLFGLSIGLVGAAIGAVFGALLGRGMTTIYTAVFDIPDLVARFHLPTVLLALVFGAIAGYVASVPPARTVAGMEPAEAMRGDAPPRAGKRSIFETVFPPLRNAPVRWRMSLRGIGRNKKRSTSMVIGVILAMTLILSTWGMLDTMLLAMDRQFNEVAVEDASVVLSTAVDEDQLEVLEAIGGVALAEPVVGLQASVTHGNDEFATALEGYLSNTEVHGFDEPLPATGVLLGQKMEDLLSVSVDDPVVIHLPLVDATITTTVMGFVDEPLGTLAYMDASALTAAIVDADPSVTPDVLAQPAITTAKVIYEDGADAEETLRAIRAEDNVAAVVDSSEIRDLIDSFQAFFYLFVGMMLLFGGAMAFALIFNIISVNVAERSGEFASMRANGLTHRRVAALIGGETFLLTAIGIVPGLLIGYLAAVAFMSSFSSAEFPITAQLRPMSFIGATVAMFVVAGLSLMPAIRAVKRIDVGEIVRERST